MLPFILLHFLCTHLWQLVHCIELLPTPLYHLFKIISFEHGTTHSCVMLPRDKNWRLNQHVSVLSLLWHCGGWRLVGTMRSFGTHTVEKQWQSCFAVYTDTDISVVFCADSLLKRMVWSCCWSLCNRKIRRWETLHRGCCQSLLLIRQLHWNCANSGMHTQPACIMYVLAVHLEWWKRDIPSVMSQLMDQENMRSLQMFLLVRLISVLSCIQLYDIVGWMSEAHPARQNLHQLFQTVLLWNQWRT